MILDVVIFKNEKIGAFTQPQFIDVEPHNAAVQLVRSMKLNPEKATHYQNLTMWYMGKFDDETGLFTLEDEYTLLADLRITWKEMEDELLCKTGEHEENSEAVAA